MGLKLTLQRKDKILIGDDIEVEILTTSDKQTQIEVHAPRRIEVHAHFDDPAKQYKNRRKAEKQNDQRRRISSINRRAPRS